LRAFLGADPDGAGARLDKWCWGNELGWVIDSPTDIINLNGRLFGFDTTALLSNKTAAPPSLLYLFYRVRRRLDGRPVLLPVDEGWSVLGDAVFGAAIEAELRTIRSRNGAIVFITQSPSDAVRSGIAAALVQQCPTQIHGANTRMTRSDFVEGLARTEEEFAIVSNLPHQRGQFLLCRARESQVIELPMAGLDDDMAILSTREEDHWAIDAAVAEAGDDPIHFVDLYHRHRKAGQKAGALT
jgi:type IV secretion system protein VirB4